MAPSVRIRSAISLGQVRPAEAETVPALHAALEDPEKEVRQGALRSLAALAPDADPTIAALEHHARDDPDPWVRIAAAEAYAALRPGPARALVTALLEADSPYLREAARRILGNLPAGRGR